MANPITMPAVPAVGIPTGEKEAGQRVDFKPTKFDLLIESHGYRLAWTRSSECPCAPVSDAAEGQVDPNCPRCKGLGVYYFGHPGVLDTEDAGVLDSVQQAIVDTQNAMVIRGVVTGINRQFDAANKVGHWARGSLYVTVRGSNLLGWYDRLVCLDMNVAYSETVIADGTDLLSMRYLITGVNKVVSETRDYTPDADYEIDTGKLKWINGQAPTSGTRISIHYQCHPTFLVIEHPHVARITNQKNKTLDLLTPRGNPTQLPIQALLQYEFIPRT